MSFSSIAESVADLSLSEFDDISKRCKPRSYPDGRREWTPMASIILVRGAIDTQSANARHNGKLDMKCVSLATDVFDLDGLLIAGHIFSTGTKCLPASHVKRCNGLVLHDSHAEVLALRGLNRWVLHEIKLLLMNEEHESDFIEPTSVGSVPKHNDTNSTAHIQGDFEPPFQFRAEVSIYMFTTTAPCGDASMDLLIAASEDQTPWSADSLASDLSTGQPLGRGHFSHLGAVRRKPARGDAEATMSKSCTDKIALKQFTSALSFPADLFMRANQNAYLKGLVVYDDQYDQVGYERAFGRDGRLSTVANIDRHLFSVKALPHDFRRFNYAKTTGPKKCKATNISAVCVAPAGYGPFIEETLVNGVKQGNKQFENQQRKGSLLCRRKMLEAAMEILALLKQKGIQVGGMKGGLYSSLKGLESRRWRRAIKESVVAKLGGWVTNAAEDDFEIGPAEEFLPPPPPSFDIKFDCEQVLSD